MPTRRRLREYLCWLLLTALAACGAGPQSSSGRPAPSIADSGPPAESSPPSGSGSVEPIPSEIPAFTVFAPGVISSDDEEYRISFTPDGQTAYFARGSEFFPQTRQAAILESHLVDGTWTEPVVVSFSGTYPDIDPWVSPDGNSIYFSSIRPVGGEPRPDVEVWRVDRAGDGWGEPVHLAAIGSTSDELGASVTADGVVWFASERPGGTGGWDLYTAQPSADGFATPEPVAAFNTLAWEFNPAISADGTLLAFTSINREGGSGLGDLFVARQIDGQWAAEEPVPVNSGADEYHPSFSPDGTTLYFVRRAANGDLYETPLPPQ